MPLRSLFAAVLLLALGVPYGLSGSAHAQATSALEPAFPNLSFATPLELTFAPDGTNLLYVAEKSGRIQTFENDRMTTALTTALDITSLVRNVGEQGFLGMALHPDFAQNGYVYVHYSGRPDGRTVLARYTRSASTPTVFDPASALVLLELQQPFPNHNGAKLAFGPDGYLYLSLGDGGSGNDPGNRSQNRTVLFGKLLRLDVDNPAPPLNYGIPPTNPFVGNADGYREEIYAYGLRNMSRFSFDRATGTLWGADVGQNTYEEIHLVANGDNLGWRIMEGFHCNPAFPAGCDQTGLTLPIYEYTHADGCSISGGIVYHGVRNPDLEGEYLFSDYCNASIWGLTYDGTTATRRTIGNAGSSVIAFGEDAAGEPYVLREASGPNAVMRFVPRPVAGEESPSASALRLRTVGMQPFRERTSVEATVPAGGEVRVTLHDVLGRELAVLHEGMVAAGVSLRVGIDGRGLAAGVYLVRLDAGAAGTEVLQIARTR